MTKDQENYLEERFNEATQQKTNSEYFKGLNYGQYLGAIKAFHHLGLMSKEECSRRWRLLNQYED